MTGFLHKPLSPEMIEESANEAVRTVGEGMVAPAEVQPAVAPAAAPAASAAAEAVAPPPLTVFGVLKNMALFLAAPFIGLVYAVLLPFVGFGMLLWVATEGLRKSKADAGDATQQASATAEAAVAAAAAAAPAARPARAEVAEPAEPLTAGGTVLLAAKLLAGLVAAPFIGLAYIVVMPFAGLAALAWLGMKAAFVRAE